LLELPPTSAGVAIVIGLAALLAAATGATVKIAGNELGAHGRNARALTALLGAMVVAWSAWSLRDKPFEVTRINGGRLDAVQLDQHQCVSEVEVALLVDFRYAPGTVRCEQLVSRAPRAVHAKRDAPDLPPSTSTVAGMP
jgi:hypothetical protein